MKVSTMPAKLKAEWVKELRSGEWIQVEGTLHDPHAGGFCCLGVLQYIQSDGQCELIRENHTQFASMPTPKWLHTNGIHFNDNDLDALIGMNDNGHHPDGSFIVGDGESGTFAAIADYIEKHVEGV